MIVFSFALAAAIFVAAQCQDIARPNSPFRWKRPKYVMPWLRGPNMCAVEEVEGTRKQYFSDCMPMLPRTVCQKPTYIRFHCCTGYEKTADGESGCRGVKPIHDLMETAKHLYLRDFRENIQEAGLEQNFKTQGPYTMFAPHNDALKDISSAQRDLLATQDETQSLLRLHVVDGRNNMADLRNGDRLTSLYYSQEKGHLKINRYTNGITTVNCVRIILPDQSASNGVIHITEKVLEPHSTRQSAMDVLLKDDRFGEFVTALITADVGEELRDKDKSFTVFAPTDEAFRNTDPEIIERILQSKDLVRKMLRYHIVDESLCSPAIIGDYRYTTREGQKVNLTCDINDNILVNGKPVLDRDIVASNAVIHVVNDVLIPDSVKALGDIMLDLDLGQFIEYSQQAGFSEVMTGATAGNFTVFAPTAEAFNNLDQDTRRRIQTDSDLVKKVISYHVVPEAVKTRDMTDGMSLPTLGDTPLRVTLYQKEHGVNSAKIISANHAAGNGVVHVVDRILFPPEENAYQKIIMDPRLTTFYTALEKVGLLEKLQKSGHLTVFAPTNEAFDELPTSVLQRLLSDESELEKMIDYHILHKPVFTNYLRSNLMYRYQTLTKDYLRMERRGDNPAIPITVNDHSKILQANIESTTGVIHVVDKLLRCPCVDALQNLPTQPRPSYLRRGDTRAYYRRYRYYK